MSSAYVADRLEQIIYRLEPPLQRPADLPLSTALDELRAWLADAHQSANARSYNWSSLLDDLLGAWGRLPHAVLGCAQGVGDPHLQALADVRQRLANDDEVMSDGDIEKLANAEVGLRRVLRDPDVLTAAWTDLKRAIVKSRGERERDALALLAQLAELQGRSWSLLAARIWRILGDEDHAIDAARAELAGQEPPTVTAHAAPAGLDAEARLALAEAVLRLPGPRGSRVVWLAFDFASVAQPPVRVGPWVTLFDGRSFIGALGSPQANRGWVPQEAIAHAALLESVWERPADDEAFPFALMRIDLGDGLVAAALDEAHATADTLVRLAAFYNRGHTSWRIYDSYALFVDECASGSTPGLKRSDRPDGKTLEMAKDRTAGLLHELAPEIGQHLSATGEKVTEALELLRWLSEARGSWRPAELLLHFRVVETVAAWAGERDPERFVNKHLAGEWAIHDLTEDVADVVKTAVHELNGTSWDPASREQRAAFAEAIDQRQLLTHEPGMRELVNIRAALSSADWLLSKLTKGSTGWLGLEDLHRRVATPAAARKTLVSLQKTDFLRLWRRARRTRNSIAHGGPIQPELIATLWRFVDAISADALNQALAARLRGDDVAEVFERRTAAFRTCMAALEGGAPLSAALPGDA